jgi:hypothetical protein
MEVTQHEESRIARKENAKQPAAFEHFAFFGAGARRFASCFWRREILFSL